MLTVCQDVKQKYCSVFGISPQDFREIVAFDDFYFRLEKKGKKNIYTCTYVWFCLQIVIFISKRAISR